MNGIINLNNHIFKYRNKGYTSIINQVVDIAIHHNSKFGNLNLLIDDYQILENYYSVNNPNGHLINSSDFFIEDFFVGMTQHNTYNAHTEPNLDNLKLRNKIFNSVLKLKDEINDEILELKDKFNIGENTLGIQIRGTDKVSEVPKINDNLIIDNVNKLINNHNISNIFLSTDDIYYIDLLSQHFSDKLIFNSGNTISHDSNPIHFVNERQKLNKEVLIDVYLLSECPYFLYCYSNVSFLSLSIGIDKFKIYKNLNNED